MKNFILALNGMLLLSGCAGFNENAAVSQEKCNTESSKSCEISQMPVSGIYKTTFPCASCSGIDATLTLNSDGTFMIKKIYRSKDKFTEVSKGKYTVLNNVVTTTDEYKEKISYKFDGKNLHMLNMDGTPMAFGLEDGYTLRPIE